MMKKFSNILIFCFAFLTGQNAAISDEFKDYVRQGNNQYEKKKYSEAEISYRKALESKRKFEGLFNLGDALYRSGRYVDAADNFLEAASTATEDKFKADAFFNLGNCYLKLKEYPKSIEAFKNALRRNPNDADARYNLEYARSMIKKSGSGSGKDQKKTEPSEFAKKLKKQAEELVAKHRFGEALGLMARGMQQDSTVAAFNEFIGRLKTIVDIDQGKK